MSEHILTFNNVPSNSIGLIIDGYFSRGVAQRRFKKIPVSGHNGDYFIDLESYDNVEESYKAFWIAKSTPQENEAQFQQIVRWMKQNGYYRLEDSDLPGYYWKARAQGVKKSNVINRRDCYYEIPLVFDRVPQCYLIAGDAPVEFPRAVGKNILPLPYYSSSGLREGIQFQVNPDGSVTLNGVAEQSVTFNFAYSRQNTPWILAAGDYILSGCPQGGSYSSYRLACNARTGSGDTSTVLATDLGRDSAGVLFSIESGVSYTGIGVYIQISAGTVCNNLTFFPMVRAASSEDPVWEPYLKDRLYNPFDEIAEPLITLTSDGGGVLTINGVNYTIGNYTGSVTIDSELNQIYGGNGQTDLSNLFEGDFPVLPAGISTVAISEGLSNVQIRPRWWTR